jgi:hypothetical protein
MPPDTPTTTSTTLVLWHRAPGKGQRWQPFAVAETERQAIDQTGRRPWDKPPPRG